MQATRLSVKEANGFFQKLTLTESQQQISYQILKEIRSRLSFLRDVGLNYLTLDRSSATLSGGEAQRIRLATQIGSALSGVLYVLDEPSIGLHQRDNQKLIDTLKHLRDLGNTVLVVEHDEATIREADYLVDLGPGAGVHGGYITAQGKTEEVALNPDSITGRYLSGELNMEIPSTRRAGNSHAIRIEGANKNNLKHIDVEIPLGKLVVFTGVSGSGKSSLLNEVLLPAVRRQLSRKHPNFDGFSTISGVEYLDKVINTSTKARLEELQGSIRQPMSVCSLRFVNCLPPCLTARHGGTRAGASLSMCRAVDARTVRATVRSKLR
jgi:excinuclease ABC subunit A